MTLSTDKAIIHTKNDGNYAMSYANGRFIVRPK